MVFDIANFYKNSKNYEEAIDTIHNYFIISDKSELSQIYYIEEEEVMSD